ncbi:MAG: Ig-like domain-containing protein [Janthinobacterium lividum]
MQPYRFSSLPCAMFALCALSGSLASAQLAVTYGAAGVQQLSYNGVTLENTQTWPADSFHIWHMKVSDLQGNLLPTYGWGENNNGRSWNASTHTWTYLFPWGSIRTQFVQTGDTLNMVVTETNRVGSGVILDGAAIYSLALHFPGLPAGFMNASYPQVQFNTTGPSAMLADFGAGEVAVVAPDAAKPLYSAFWPTDGSSPVYTALISSTTPDGLATFQPHNDRPVAPGQVDTFTVSLRFAPSGTALSRLAADAYASWGATWPAQLKWTDKRVIGTSYLASSPQGGDVTVSGGYPNNPRRYFNDSNASDFDVRNPLGLSRFQSVVLQRARDIVTNLQRLNAQGTITWDLEGEEYPQATSYVCSPDQVATVAPEMDAVIADPNSPYAGQRLDDAYFKIITNAGFRVGVCIRPQQFTRSANGTAQQVSLSDTAAEAIMLQKIRYAHDRWGATLFYIDSTVEPNGAVLDAGMFQRIASAFPDSLLIPEESTPKHYAYTAPFQTFLFHQDLGTDKSIYAYYPKAFSVNMINDVDPFTLARYTPQLIASVAAGDILMAHADYWDNNNPAILAIYAAAGVLAPITTAPVTTIPITTTPVTTTPVTTTPVTTTPVTTTPVTTTPVTTTPVTTTPVTTTPVTTTPVTTTPVTTTPITTTPVNPVPTSLIMIQSPSAGDTITGNVQVVVSMATTLDAAGSYLMVDGQQIGTQRLTSPPFRYNLDASTLAAGNHTLQIWGHDTANEVLLSNTVTVVAAAASVVTAPAAPVITAPTQPIVTAPVPYNPVTINYPASGQAISSPLTVATTINAALDAAASFLMVDGVPYGYQRVGSAPYLYALDPGVLTAGPHTLQVWAHSTNNEVLISAPVSITVVH